MTNLNVKEISLKWISVKIYKFEGFFLGGGIQYICIVDMKEF